jgi:hypothetical protein
MEDEPSGSIYPDEYIDDFADDQPIFFPMGQAEH